MEECRAVERGWGEVAGGEEVRAVVLQQPLGGEVLVDAVVIVDCPGGRVGQVLAKGDVGTRGSQHSQEGGEDVDVLGDLGLPSCGEMSRRVVEEDGDAVGSQRGLVLGLFADVGVVGGDDEEGVAEPGLLATGGEKLA